MYFFAIPKLGILIVKLHTIIRTYLIFYPFSNVTALIRYAHRPNPHPLPRNLTFLFQELVIERHQLHDLTYLQPQEVVMVPEPGLDTQPGANLHLCQLFFHPYPPVWWHMMIWLKTLLLSICDFQVSTLSHFWYHNYEAYFGLLY